MIVDLLILLMLKKLESFEASHLIRISLKFINNTLQIELQYCVSTSLFYETKNESGLLMHTSTLYLVYQDIFHTGSHDIPGCQSAWKT